jgi:uncharacterized membrane protein YoaK (UPF0700 family)
MPSVVAAMCAVAAMAVQNALIQIALATAPSTAVMTTNLTRLMKEVGAVLVGGDAADIAKAKSRTAQVGSVLGGFAIGCGLGAPGRSDRRPLVPRVADDARALCRCNEHVERRRRQ